MKSLLMTAAVLLASMASAEYNETRALSALMYCKAAYCDYNMIPDWSCPTCKAHHPKFTKVTMHRNASTQFVAYTGYNPEDNQVVVAFRGTDNIENWILDFTFFPVKYPGCVADGEECHVHDGFLMTWQSVKPQIMADVQQLMSTTGATSIMVTGHSLAAAVSLLAALDITPLYNDKTIHLYNFGQPRVGCPNFVKFAGQKLQNGEQWRVTHKEDPVPHVPTEFMGFLHVPHEIWYNHAGNGASTYKVCQDSVTAEDSKCSDSILPLNVFDHVKYLGHCLMCEGQPFLGECPL